MDFSWFSQLSEPLQTLLLGGGGDYLGGMGAAATAALLEAVNRRVSNRFVATPRQQALNLAIAEAMYRTVGRFSRNFDEFDHFLTLFGEWLAREDVADEFAQLLDPRPDAELDFKFLAAEFEAVGFAPNLLGDENAFPQFVNDFVDAFFNAASKQPELQEGIKIDLLGQMAAGIAESARLANEQLQESKSQTGYLERIADRVAPDLSPRRRNYLQRLQHDCQFLPLRGIDFKTADATTGAKKRMTLADVYINLDTTAKFKGDRIFKMHAEDGARLVDLTSLSDDAQPLPALAAFAANPRMVLLGDPGGGKSTFVNHLTYRLTTHQLADETGDFKQLPEWPAQWRELLPVRIILRELAAWAATCPDQADRSALLLAYLRYWLTQIALDDYYPALCAALKEGRALLLLDGLDEVPVDPDHRSAVKAMIADLPQAFPGCPILVTCRVLSYQDEDWRLDSAAWPTFELDKLDGEKIDRFITAWSHQLATMGVKVDPKAFGDKLERAVRRPDLWPLARNPLLLTVMAIVHTHKDELPDARALLYEDVVDLLLWRWEAIKIQSKDGEETDLRLLLQEANLADIDLKQALWELAFDAHGQVEGDAARERTADIPVATLHRVLRKLHPKQSLDWADDVVKIMQMRAGLLVEGLPEVYSFPHRTFEEYLAGCHLSKMINFNQEVVKLANQGAFWRDVILLAVGRLIHHTGDTAKPLILVSELCPRRPPHADDAVAWRNVWLAGQCLLDIGLSRAARLDIGPELIERVQTRLTTLITHDHLTPRERAEAGSVLAAIGDPRDLDEMMPVPGGEFIMGSSGADEDAVDSEKPQHTLTVADFRMGKYPVTNGQYVRFVAATGHEAPSHWRGERPPAELRNHPVVYVSWDDARAYCDWLSGERGEEVRLPTEAEWEKAARGVDGRIYPWGDGFDAERCNMDETGIGETSPVGIFAGGASPYDVLDMSGNVVEWCLTEWLGDYEDYENRVNNDPAGRASRVLRGGSFFDNRRDVRSAYRLNYVDFRYLGVGLRVVSPGLETLASDASDLWTL